MKNTLIILASALALLLAACGGGSNIDDHGYCKDYCTNFEACEKAAGHGFNMAGCMDGCTYAYPGLQALRDDAFMTSLQQCLKQSGCNPMADCVKAAIVNAHPTYSSDPNYQMCTTLAQTCNNSILAFEDNCVTMFSLEAKTPLEGASSTPFENAVACAKGVGFTADGCLDRSALAKNFSEIVTTCVQEKIDGTRADDCADKRAENIAKCQDPDKDNNVNGDGPYFCRRNGSSCTVDADCKQQVIDNCKQAPGPYLCSRNGVTCTEDSECATGNGESCMEGLCVTSTCSISAPNCGNGYTCVEIDSYCDVKYKKYSETCAGGVCLQGSCDPQAAHCNSGFTCVEENAYCAVAEDANIETCRINACADEEEAATNDTLSACLQSQPLSACFNGLHPEYVDCLCFNAAYCLNDVGTFSFPTE